MALFLLCWLIGFSAYWLGYNSSHKTKSAIYRSGFIIGWLERATFQRIIEVKLPSAIELPHGVELNQLLEIEAQHGSRP